MPLKLTRPTLLLLACAVALPVAGCAGKKAKTDTAYIARDVNTLYALAKDTLDKRRYEEAAAKLGVELIVIQAGTGESLAGAVGAARSRGAQALAVQADGIFFQYRAALVEALGAQKMPAIFSQRESVEAGGLMSYGPNETEGYRRAASYVDRLLKGARASELAIERPAKIELAINPKTAAALGLALPGALLHSADRIVR